MAITVHIPISKEVVGLLVGRGGKRINALRAMHGVKKLRVYVDIAQAAQADTAFATPTGSPVAPTSDESLAVGKISAPIGGVSSDQANTTQQQSASGSTPADETSERYVVKVRGRTQPDVDAVVAEITKFTNLVIESIIIPASAVSSLFGQKAATIKDIQNIDGLFSVSVNTFEQNPTCMLRGTADAVNTAKSRIERLVNASNARLAGLFSCTITVPYSALGLVIGRQGNSFKRFLRFAGVEDIVHLKHSSDITIYGRTQHAATEVHQRIAHLIHVSSMYTRLPGRRTRPVFKRNATWSPAPNCKYSWGTEQDDMIAVQDDDQDPWPVIVRQSRECKRLAEQLARRNKVKQRILREQRKIRIQDCQPWKRRGGKRSHFMDGNFSVN